jgi:hypothetical protein
VLEKKSNIAFNHWLRKLMEDHILMVIVLLEAKTDRKIRPTSQEYTKVYRFIIRQTK